MSRNLHPTGRPKWRPPGWIPVAGSVLALTLSASASEPANLAASGEDVPAQKLKTLSLEELMQLQVATVTTASKRPEKATSAPGTVLVIDQEDIRLRGYSTLKDVLRDVPGMQLTDDFFSELGTQVAVRGLTGNNRIVVLVNGMRVNPPGGEYFPFRSDFSVRQAEQIEIIYGSGSTLYGQDAISAVINVKMKTPPANGRPSVEVGADGGLNFEREAWGSFGKVFDAARNIFLNGFVQYHDSELTPLDSEYPRWWRAYREVAAPKGSGTVPVRRDFGLNGFVQLQIGDFSLQSWYRDSLRSSAEGYGGGPVLAFIPEGRWEDRSWVSEARYHWRITDKVALDSAGTFNWFEVVPDSRYIEPLDATHWFYEDYKYADGKSITAEETLHVDFSKSLSVLLGGVYNNYDIIPKSTVPGAAHPGSHTDIIRQGGSFVYYTEVGNPASAHSIPRVVDVEFERYGAYLEASWQINSKLKLIAGGRVDKDSRISEPSYTPRGALIYNLTDSFTAKYTYSWAYISPAPYFGFATYDRGDILNTSNPNLQPETSKTHEVNFTYNKEAINLGLSLYYANESNLILVSDVGSQPNILADTVYLDLAGTQKRRLTHTVNSGKSRNAGLDFYGKAKLNKNFSLWYSYSYATYEQSTAGIITGLNGISHHNFRLGGTWAVTPSFFITPSLVASSTPRNVDPGTLGSELHNPWSANLHLLYAVRSYLDLYADLRNITNNHTAGGGFVGGAIPQETFSAVFGLRIKF